MQQQCVAKVMLHDHNVLLVRPAGQVAGSIRQSSNLLSNTNQHPQFSPVQQQFPSWWRSVRVLWMGACVCVCVSRSVWCVRWASKISEKLFFSGREYPDCQFKPISG